MRIVLLALATVPFLATSALAGNPAVPLAPVWTNKALCIQGHRPIIRVSDGPRGCCTEAGGCAQDLQTTKIEKQVRAGKL